MNMQKPIAIALLTGLTALGTVDALAGLTYQWQYREAFARYGVTDASTDPDTDIQMGDSTNYSTGSFAKLQAQDMSLLAFASSQITTSEASFAGSYAFDVDLNLVLASQLLPSIYDGVYSSGYAYWQLRLVSDTPFNFTMTKTESPASGSGVEQHYHFTQFSGPQSGNLMTAGTHYFYGELKYTLRDATGNVQLIAPSTHASLVLTPVPEPETWAMLLAGLGLVGLKARRVSVVESASIGSSMHRF